MRNYEPDRSNDGEFGAAACGGNHRSSDTFRRDGNRIRLQRTFGRRFRDLPGDAGGFDGKESRSFG